LVAGLIRSDIRVIYKPLVQINKAVDLESAMLEASSTGLLTATAFDASSLRIVAVIVLILLVYARAADVHEPTAVLRAVFAVAN
jgi:hypothetical protein